MLIKSRNERERGRQSDRKRDTVQYWATLRRVAAAAVGKVIKIAMNKVQRNRNALRLRHVCVCVCVCQCLCMCLCAYEEASYSWAKGHKKKPIMAPAGRADER